MWRRVPWNVTTGRSTWESWLPSRVISSHKPWTSPLDEVRSTLVHPSSEHPGRDDSEVGRAWRPIQSASTGTATSFSEISSTEQHYCGGVDGEDFTM